MAIKKQTNAESKRDWREALQPFLKDESGIHALHSFIQTDGTIQRGGMYLLEILNNLISSNNGTSNLYQRIPPEVRGGLPEGGRRNVQASLIQRAVLSAEPQEQGKGSQLNKQTGYTRLQEVIGLWAEKDGCWSDTPETDLIKKGYHNDSAIDGSEARVFKKEGMARLMKTIDCQHFQEYNSEGHTQAAFELQLDRITIHNATHPHAALRIEGFGMRETADDNIGFEVIVSQPVIIGKTPQWKKIVDSMEKRGYELSENGIWFVSKRDNTILKDINENNCLETPEGRIVVYDCDAYLKQWPIEPKTPEKISMEKLMPQHGKFNEEAWQKVFGQETGNITDEVKTSIINELRLNGTINGPVCGKILTMQDQSIIPYKMPDGNVVPSYRGDILFGEPKQFKEEHIYKIPELRYEPSASTTIQKTCALLAPIEIGIKDFFNSIQNVNKNGETNTISGTEQKENLKRELQETGRIEGLVNEKYHVQLDKNSGKVLINEKKNIEFMLWTKDIPLDNGETLSSSDKEILASGQKLKKNGHEYFFDINKGRIDESHIIQQKKKLALPQDIKVEKPKETKKNRIRL